MPETNEPQANRPKNKLIPISSLSPPSIFVENNVLYMNKLADFYAHQQMQNYWQEPCTLDELNKRLAENLTKEEYKNLVAEYEQALNKAPTNRML